MGYRLLPFFLILEKMLIRKYKKHNLLIIAVNLDTKLMVCGACGFALRTLQFRDREFYLLWNQKLISG